MRKLQLLLPLLALILLTDCERDSTRSTDAFRERLNTSMINNCSITKRVSMGNAKPSKTQVPDSLLPLELRKMYTDLAFDPALIDNFELEEDGSLKRYKLKSDSDYPLKLQEISYDSTQQVNYMHSIISGETSLYAYHWDISYTKGKDGCAEASLQSENITKLTSDTNRLSISYRPE